MKPLRWDIYKIVPKTIKNIGLIIGLLSLPYTIIEAKAGLHFTYFFNKKNIKCKIEYTITGNLPIRIQRTYEDGSTEWIILREPLIENAQEVHELVNASRGHLKKYMYYALEKFGDSVAQATASIQLMRHYRSSKFYVFIFYKGKKDKHERLVGATAMQAYGEYRKGSQDIMYWVGSTEYIKAKGIAGEAVKALINFTVAKGNVKYINCIVDKLNVLSLKIPKRFKMKEINPKSYDNWGYDGPEEDSRAYTLTTKEWKEKHWKGAVRYGTVTA